jgi:hypothetical protein
MFLTVLVIISIIFSIISIVYTYSLKWYYEKIYDAFVEIMKDSKKS